MSTGLAMIEIGAAMKIFASAMADFGSMSLAEIGKGLLAMGGALAEVALATKLMPKNMVALGTGLIAVGAALELVADSLNKMGGMSWESVAKGLVTLGVSLLELAAGLKLMNGSLAGSAAVLVAAGALAVLTPGAFHPGFHELESIVKGLVAVAGAFGVIGAAGAILTPLVPTILGLAGAFALIGVGAVGIGAGLLAIGAGLSAIAIGVTALATSLGAGVTVIVAGLTSIITGIAALIPAIAEKFGEAIVAFCQVITDGAPAIGEAVKALVLTLVGCSCGVCARHCQRCAGTDCRRVGRFGDLHTANRGLYCAVLSRGTEWHCPQSAGSDSGGGQCADVLLLWCGTG